jgi:hypothetical protein
VKPELMAQHKLCFTKKLIKCFFGQQHLAKTHFIWDLVEKLFDFSRASDETAYFVLSHLLYANNALRIE